MLAASAGHLDGQVVEGGVEQPLLHVSHGSGLFSLGFHRLNESISLLVS